MTNLENIFIAIVLNNNKTSQFAQQIKGSNSKIEILDKYFKDRKNNIFIGDITNISSIINFDFEGKTSLKELETNDGILFIMKNEDGECKLLEARLNPEAEYDWINTINDFLINVQEDKTDANGYWKWGQIVQEDGEFLCVDCGLVIELKKGDVFPICEVCLSGDPSAPDSKSDEGFWEMV